MLLAAGADVTTVVKSQLTVKIEIMKPVRLHQYVSELQHEVVKLLDTRWKAIQKSASSSPVSLFKISLNYVQSTITVNIARRTYGNGDLIYLIPQLC